MSRTAKIELDWADGTYPFALRFGELVLLQEATDAGPYIVLNRLVDGSWRVGDISNVIRLGLIGGGMKPTDALSKVRQYVEARPPLENIPCAQAILSAAIVGAPEENDQKKSEDVSQEQTNPPTFLTENSGMPESTEPAPL